MMAVQTLPIEVWVIIIKKLDTRSLCNLYESCSYLRNVICMHGIVKECKFSLNALATVKSLKLNFLRDISGHLEVLNLSAVSDLNKSYLILTLKRLKNLIELDVSYTNIVLPDLFAIVKACPTLKTLAINFVFGKKYKVSKNWLEDYQQAFMQLQNIHFVGSISDLLYGKLVIDMIKKTNLNSLNMTVCGDYYFIHNYADDDDSNNTETLKLPQFKLYFIKETLNDPLLELPIFKSLDLKKYEIVVFQTYMSVNVYGTPLLKEFICKSYDADVQSLDELAPVVSGEVAVMLWHRETTSFDNKFYSKLLLILKEYLIFNLDSSNLKPVPAKYKWCSVDQLSLEPERDHDVKEIKFKKARIAQPNLALSYDEALRQKEDIVLRINFKMDIARPVTITNSGYLKKISHLTLYGEVQYSPDFFKILFECCDTLVTLEILKKKSTVALPKLLQFLPKSRLKNILLTVSEFLGQLFKYLCDCRTLENVYLVNPTMVFEALPDPTELFKNCDSMYYFCFQSNMPDLDKMLKFYKKVRSKVSKDGLNIDMFTYRDERRTSRYSPYFSVFDIHHLKPLAFV